MNSLDKVDLAVLLVGVLVAGVMLSGCVSQKNKNPETVSRQDKDSAATIDRQEASGDSSATEAAIQRDSLERDHLLKF